MERKTKPEKPAGTWKPGFKETLLLVQALPLAEHLLTPDTLWGVLVSRSRGDALRDQPDPGLSNAPH